MHGQLQLDRGGREKGTEEGEEGAVYVTRYVAWICIDTGGSEGHVMNTVMAEILQKNK